MTLVAFATLWPKPGKHEEVLAAFGRHASAVHAEPGCLFYAAYSGDDRIKIVEHWANQGAFDAHSKGAAVRALGADIAGALAKGIDVEVMTPVPAGDPGKGQLPNR